jgi:hypothetical protein
MFLHLASLSVSLIGMSAFYYPRRTSAQDVTYLVHPARTSGTAYLLITFSQLASSALILTVGLLCETACPICHDLPITYYNLLQALARV